PFDELSELGRLYRGHTARLARLLERDDDPAAIRHLNALCVRAYSFLYVPPPSERSLRTLFLVWLPDALGRTWRAQLLAWGLLLTGIALCGALAWRDPQSLHAFMPGGAGYTPDGIDRLIASPQARADFLGRGSVPATINAFFGSQLFAHNTRVGLLAFATGMLGGVPTVLLHLYNGIVLGAFAAIFFRDPLPLDFLAWILPHGIPELTAITLCAAAGLCLGGAVARPGRQGRRRALREAVNPALLLFAGSIPLFALAQQLVEDDAAVEVERTVGAERGGGRERLVRAVAERDQQDAVAPGEQHQRRDEGGRIDLHEVGEDDDQRPAALSRSHLARQRAIVGLHRVRLGPAQELHE